MPGRAGPACPSCSSPTWLQRTFCATSPKPPRGPSPNVIAAPSTEALRSDGNEPATSAPGSRRRGKACNASPTSTIGWRSAPDLNDPPGLATRGHPRSEEGEEAEDLRTVRPVSVPYPEGD